MPNHQCSNRGNMIEGRTALYKGFMVVIHPSGMEAYRSTDFFSSNITSYIVPPDTDITTLIDDAEDHGDFTQEQFEELAGASALIPIVDVCVGCGQDFPAEMLLYEGVEPVVYAPRCHICQIKQMQDKFGAENVILGEEFTN